MHRYSSPSSPSTRYTNRHGKTTMEGWKAECGLCQSQEQTITHCPIKSLSPRLVSEAQLEGTSHRSSCGPSMPPGIGESSSKEREEGGMGNETGRGGTERRVFRTNDVSLSLPSQFRNEPDFRLPFVSFSLNLDRESG